MAELVDVPALVATEAVGTAMREPSLLRLIREDVGCVRLRDPAARSEFETLLTYPGHPCRHLASSRASAVAR